MGKVPFILAAAAFAFAAFVPGGMVTHPYANTSTPPAVHSCGIFLVHDSVYGSTWKPEVEIPGRSSHHLEVFDRFGRLVYEKELDVTKAGAEQHLSWSGTDNRGRPVARDIYFFRVTGGRRNVARPIGFSEIFWFLDVTPTHLPPDSSEAADIEFGDVDNDGDLDIISGINAFTHFAQPKLLINRGSGIYADETDARLPELQTVTNDVDLADVDNDGDLDIYLANTGFSPSDCRDLLLINDGKGYFKDESEERLRAEMFAAQNVEFGDVDGDGDLDLALAILGGRESPLEVHLLLNDGKGRFEDKTEGRIPSSLRHTLFNVTLENVDKDGDDDMIISSLGKMIITDPYGSPLDTLSGQNLLLLNDGQGYFRDGTEGRMPVCEDDWTTKIRVEDVNGDHRADLFVINIGFSWEQASNRLYLNEGEGFFKKDVIKLLCHEAVLWNNDAELADFDNDRDLDIFMINVRPGEEAFDNLLINERACFSNQSWRLPEVLDFSTSCAVGNVDGDSDFDLVIANSSGTAGMGGQDRLYENVLLKTDAQILAGVSLRNDTPMAKNYPNPFNPATDIVFYLAEDAPRSSPAVIRIYNVTGQLVRTLACGLARRGENRISWDGKDDRNEPVSSGIYFYQLEAGGFSSCGRMTMIK
jgi:hypothetical protein